MEYAYEPPVYVKDPKDIPERLKVHRWLPTVDVKKLPKHQLKVKMCCAKCEEKVLEEIWEVPGVFDVRACRIDRKVVVTAMPYGPGGLDEHEVLRKARKIDSKARFVEPDQMECQPDKPIPEPDCPFNTSLPCPPEFYGPVPPHWRGCKPGSSPDYVYPPDGIVPFYFLLFLLLLVSMFVFTK